MPPAQPTPVLAGSDSHAKRCNKQQCSSRHRRRTEPHGRMSGRRRTRGANESGARAQGKSARASAPRAALTAQRGRQFPFLLFRAGACTRLSSILPPVLFVEIRIKPPPWGVLAPKSLAASLGSQSRPSFCCVCVLQGEFMVTTFLAPALYLYNSCGLN